MQNIFIERPYQFLGPFRSTILPRIIRDAELFRWHLRKNEGVGSVEVRNADNLRASLDAGKGVLLTPNHPRTADPIVLGSLAKELRCLFYAMASSHLFHNGWKNRFLIRVMGGFSVNREGSDRQAINTAIEAMVEAKRPLIVFGEGTATRANDHLTDLMDGLSFMARAAAKKRAKTDGGEVVVHPIAIKYFFRGDVHGTTEPILTDIEKRLTFRPLEGAPLVERLGRIGRALLGLKEIEYFGEVQQGSFADRQAALIERLMVPIEEEWLGGPQDGGIVSRIKNVRMRIFPPIAHGEVDAIERDRRYRQLADTYLAQQVAFHPENYLTENPTVERIVETAERFEEDMTDEARVNAGWHAVLDVGPAIEVKPARDKRLETDPVTDAITTWLTQRLQELSSEGTRYQA